jgi:hypothetical protein
LKVKASDSVANTHNATCFAVKNLLFQHLSRTLAHSIIEQHNHINAGSVMHSTVGRRVYLLTAIASFIVCISRNDRDDDRVMLFFEEKWNFQRICMELFYLYTTSTFSKKY